MLLKKFFFLCFCFLFVFSLQSCSFGKQNPVEKKVGSNLQLETDKGESSEEIRLAAPSKNLFSPESTPQNDNEVLEKALRLSTKSQCESIQNIEMRAFCVQKILFSEIISKHDFSDCEKLEDKRLIQKCKDSILFKEATSQNDISLCGKIQNVDEKKECHEKLSFQNIVKKGDTGACAVLSDIALKKNCVEKAAQVFYNTIMASAKKTNDPLLCDSIKNTSLKQKCSDEIFFQKALESVSSGMCSQISEKNFQKECLLSIIPFEALSLFDPKLCQKISEEEKMKECEKNVFDALDKKIFKNARENRDSSLCSQIKNEELKNTCTSF